MKAVVLSEFGSCDRLEFRDWPDPQPRDDEVLLDVLACGVNHVDLDVRAGISRFPIQLPHILGREIVGEVTAVGTRVEGLKTGDRVMAGEMFTACWRCPQCLGGRDNVCWNVDYPGVFRPGGYAEMIAVPARDTMLLPDGLDPIDAAASQVTLGTAWRALLNRSGGLIPGERVLITAAASGVGSAAVQVAHLVGAEVIAAVGDAAKAKQVMALGADHVVDYSTTDLAAAVADLTDGGGVDLALEIAGGDLFRGAMASLRDGGRLVLVGAHGGEVVPTDLIPIFRYERAVLGSARATRSEMTSAMQALASGRIKAVVDSAIPLDQAPDAHRRLESRKNVGKVVLVPSR